MASATTPMTGRDPWIDAHSQAVSRELSRETWIKLTASTYPGMTRDELVEIMPSWLRD